ncbi:MAG: hypothetical protein M3O41_00400 [Pseudomonadota bacterium]|nr:hypothetical protein [Pseudomonadota bacterium]
MTEKSVQMAMYGIVAAEPGGQGCAIHKVHNPSVTTLVVHNLFPTDLQIMAQGANPYDDSAIDVAVEVEQVLLCPTGKLNVDAYISYLLGEGDPLPVRVGKETKALANEAVNRYEAARHAASTVSP